MMDGYQNDNFLDTKFALPIGIAAALAVSVLLFSWGLVDPMGGLCIGIVAYFILRFFRVRKIEYLLFFAALMFIAFTIGIYTLPMFSVPEDADVVNLVLNIFIVSVLPFLLISMLAWYMRRNLERVRARLEAEGRLYPPGYGRCKRCGTVVLPGEICCRRCGEYIDVPEELRVKKVDYFECSECGREVPEDAGVCPYCGETFEE